MHENDTCFSKKANEASRVTRTAKLHRRKSPRAAQKKQEMKAEETGSAHRMLCQCFVHSNRKDIMGETFLKMGSFVSHDDMILFLKAIVQRYRIKLFYQTTLHLFRMPGQLHTVIKASQNRRPVQFRHHQI